MILLAGNLLGQRTAGLTLLLSSSSTSRHRFFRYRFWLVGPFLAGAFLAGCSGNVAEKVTELEADLKDLRGIQAEQTVAINSLRAELRTLGGKIEELQFRAVGKTEELARTIQRFGSRVPPPPGVPEELLSKDEERIARNSGPAVEQYKSALLQLRAGQFEVAEQTFTTFLESNPGTAFSDNALFWTGVCFEKLGQYDRAIVAYSEVFQRYPEEDMVPPALFRLAESFVKIDSADDAIVTLQKLIEEHPKSKYARDGKKRLSQLKRRRKRRR